MQIITIYQGASGNGEELADAVAQSLGYGRVDREFLVEASKRYRISEAKLTEIVDRDLNWWETFTRRLSPYRIALEAAFCDLVGSRGVVYHGHLGHELVPKFQHVLKVLLTAPMELRIAQVHSRYPKLNDAAARRYVEQIDKARARRLMAMFGTDWRDSSRYDLVINLGYMSLETAKHLIVQAARSSDYQVTDESKLAFENFALASRVHARLALIGELSYSRVDIEANQGQITVAGTIPDWITEEQIVATIEKMPGVKSVKADLVSLSPGFGLTD